MVNLFKYNEVHQAMTVHDDDGRMTYVFELCDGNEYRFELPDHKLKCEEQHG